jgi:DNA polymerase-3 subunit gamma/tau
MSLYLKYRPQSFKDLYGQQHIKKTLQKGIELNRLAHAYLFCGPRGTGKTTSARLIAKSVNCLNFDNKNIEPCNSCDMCKEISEGSLVDVIEIDAASNRGIDEIRELRDSVQFNPYHAKNKVYIIDEVHMLTKEAFNALLKTLEEPPSNVYFILATTEVHKIPDTIISRCQRYDFKRIMEVDILERVAFINDSEGFGIEEDALKLVVRKSKGGMRDAISLLDQVSASGLTSKEDVSQVLGVTPGDELENLLELIFAGEVMKSIEKVANINNYGYGAQQINLDITTLLRDKLQKSVFEDDTAGQSRYLFLLESWQKIWDVFKESSITSLPLEVFTVKTANHFGDININIPAPSKVAESKETIEKTTEQKVVVKTTAPETTAEPEKTVKKEKVEADSNIQDIMNNEEIKIKSKKVVKKVSNKKPVNEKLADLNLFDQERLNKIWAKLVEDMKIPLLKRALQATRVRKGEDSVVIRFNSNFPYDQANKPDYVGEIASTLEREMGGKVEIDLEVDKSLAEELNRKSQSSKVKPNAFELDPNTGEPEMALVDEEAENGLSADEVADFFS